MFFWARITLLVNLNVDQCCIAFPAVFWFVARLHEVTGGTQGITLDITCRPLVGFFQATATIKHTLRYLGTRISINNGRK